MNRNLNHGDRESLAVCRWVGIAAVTVFAGLAVSASAQSDRPTLKDLTAQAELVFRGQVEGIEYAMSEPGGPEGTRVPYTFVTYRVAEVLRGENPGETVTLRFFGGLEEATGKFTSTSRSPRIDLGDDDLLFVRGNSQRMTPLVGAMDGRLRIIDGQVYSEKGNSARLDAEGGIDLGRQYRLDQVETTTVGDQVCRLKYGPKVFTLPSDAATADAVEQRVRALAAAAAPAPAAFVNADPDAPLAPPNLAPAPPPPAPKERGTPAPAEAPAEVTLRTR